MIVCVIDLANMYSMMKFTILMILQRKYLCKEASVANYVTQISKSQITMTPEIRINKYTVCQRRLTKKEKSSML